VVRLFHGWLSGPATSRFGLADIFIPPEKARPELIDQLKLSIEPQDMVLGLFLLGGFFILRRLP
jgi:hypothetical protein